MKQVGETSSMATENADHQTVPTAEEEGKVGMCGKTCVRNLDELVSWQETTIVPRGTVFPYEPIPGRFGIFVVERSPATPPNSFLLHGNLFPISLHRNPSLQFEAASNYSAN
jgi:hypothetical protein